MRTFYTWLIAQNYRNDHIGDLSRDINEDNQLPVKRTKRKLLAHLVSLDVNDYVLVAFDDAWSEYLEYRKLMLK